ncbi:hypothetical protein QWZ08_04280 [Ferruginibacter paludis]|uniref:hypothetical protein n=1 Tax=Ferruginibacter paludis TaxID=1310417 RepID=UPI0025B35DF7|nr:hypothetical protein [Ferruginibacter paludis]MDN3654832.1 hypothetical protein [Ferruginibacter paludis]
MVHLGNSPFSNKTATDIIYEKELSAMLGNQAFYLSTRGNNTSNGKNKSGIY